MAALTLSNYLGTLQHDPENEEALEGIRELLGQGDSERAGSDPVRLIEAARVSHERRGELRAAAALIELETGLVDADPDLEAALWKELGRLRQDELLDDAGAKAAYERALELRPGDDEVRESIEQIDQAAESWRQIADRFVEEADAASDATLRTSLLTRAASLVWQYKKRGAAKETDKLFRLALESDPGETRTARLYAETLRRRKRWKDLAQVVLDAAEHGRNRDDRLNLYVQAGRTFARQLEEPERAAECYQHVLEFVPGHSEALGYLVEYFTEREEWDHLIALYEDALRSRQKLESEQGILLQLAMTHWRIRGNAEDAEPYFARLRKLDPAHRGVLEFYREHLTQTGDLQRLVTILSDAQRVAETDETKRELAIELARAAQQNDATLERAIEAWKSVQRFDPQNAEARQALKELYRRTEKWNALVEVLKAEIEALPADAKERRVELLRELVPIYRDRLQLDAMVINTYNAILQDAPEDQEVLAELARTYEGMGRWNDLIQVLGKQADAAPDDATKVALLTRIANLWIERFANYNQATRPLERVIEIDPDHREALNQLKEIYTKKRAWKSLFTVLRREAELASDPDARLERKVELAKLAGERLHRHADAIELWREIVYEKPDTPGALDALEKLAEREKDWATLADALELRIEEQTDPADQIKTLQRLGSVYGDNLGDHAKSASAWKRVLELDPQNGRARRTLRESFLAARDWEGLEALYAEAGDWESLVEVLGSAAERADDPQLKVDLSLRAAHVYEEKIGEPQRAFRNYERVLSVDPKNEHAARKLIPIYEREEKWPRLSGLYEVLLAATPDDDVAGKLDRLRQLRELAANKLRDQRRAFEYAVQAYALAPDDPDVVEGLERAADAAQAHETLVGAYRDRISKTSGEEALRLRRRVASIAGEHLGRSEEAIEQLEKVLEAAPDDRETMEVLERLYEQEGRSRELRDLYASRLEHSEDRQERYDLLKRLAEIEERQLAEPESAVHRYRALLEIDPSDRDALAAVDRMATEAERWNELVDVLRQRRELAEDDEERVHHTLRLAELYEQHLSDPTSALDAYHHVIDAAPGDERAIAGLEKIEQSHPELAGEASKLLERAYEARASHEKLAGVLRRRLEAAEDEEERRDLRLRLAELSGSELGDVQGAYAALEGAFLDRPEDETLWDRLASAAERADKHEELAQAFATAIEAGDLGETQSADLAARAADIYDTVLGQPEKAEPFYKRILRHDPVHEGAFASLKELYTNQERWDDLQALYRNRIAETVDAEAKLELLLQVCFLFEEILEDPEQAIRSYQEVLELEPDHVASRRALDRLYRRTQKWRELSALLRHELDQAEGHEALESTFELGKLHEQKLSEPGTAVDYYERVLEQSPTHLRAQEALERLVEEPSERQRVAAILEPLYEEQGAFRELSRVLEVQLEELSEPGARVGRLSRLAEIYEQRLHDVDKAFDALSRAVAADPGDVHHRQELARVAAARGSQRERAAVLEAAIEASQDAFLSSELLLELAQLWDEEEGDIEAAESAYKRLLTADPDNPDAVLPASRALERIHLGRGDYQAFAEDLRRQTRFETDESVRARLLVRLADVLEESLDDPAGAIEAHQQRLEIDPADVDALRSLERLHRDRGEWQKLIGVLQSHEQVADDEAEQRDIARRIGEVYEQRLDDPDNAIVAYNDVLSRFGSDRPTLGALARLYERTEKWEDLLDTLEMEHELAETPAEQAELRFRMAELMRTKTGEVERAIESYEQVLSEVADHEGAMAALEQIVATADGPERVMAARTLAPRYEGGQAYDRLIGALEVVAETDDPLERLRTLRRAAEVADVGLEDADRAFDLMGRAIKAGLAEDDLGDMLAEYERLAAAAGRYEDYASLLREVVPDVLDGELQIAVSMKAAEVYRFRLDDPETARGLYARVLEQQPEHREALDALEELHAAASDHTGLLDVLARKAELAEDPERRVELMLRQAELCETGLGDIPRAIEAYEQVLLDAEHRQEAFEGLERLYEKEERHSDLAALYERQLDARVGDLVEIRFRLGKLHKDRLDDPQLALEQFREVLSQRRDHEGAISELEKLMEDRELRGQVAEILEPVFLTRMDWSKVTAALEARLTDEVDVERRKELLTRLAQLHEDYLEDLDGALESYARLFREDPGDQEPLDALTRLARVLERWDRLAEIYTEVLNDVSVDDDVTARLAFRTGKLHDERTGDLGQAATQYARALRFDPTDHDVFLALESVYERTERWSDLLELYREQVDIADDDATRIKLLHKAADLRELRLEDAEGAIEAHRDVLTIDPAEGRSVRALDRLLTEQKRWVDLADHLRHRIEGAVGTDEEPELRYRLGRLLADELDDKTGAIDAFEEAVQLKPDHGPTVSALEQLVLEPEHRLRITQILEPLYAEQGQWKKRIAILEAQAEMTEHPPDRAQLLAEIARLHEERGGDLSLAFHAWQRAFTLEPFDEEARRQIDRLAQQQDAWNELVAAYEEALANTDDAMVATELLTTLARVHDEKRGDPRAAIETYERLLAHEPDDPSPLDALEALHTMVGDWRGMVDVLSRRVERSFDPLERAELLRRSGSVLEELLQDAEGAIEHYRRASEEDDTDVIALESLDRLYSSAGRNEELAGVVARRIELEGDPEARVELGMRLGALYETTLGRPEDAIDVFSRVLDDQPGHWEAAVALGRLYERQGMAPELVDNLRLRISLTEEASQRVELLQRMGEVLETELDDVPEAIETYRNVLDIDPRHEPAMQALLRIAKLEDFRTQAAEIVEPLLHVQERWDDLATLIEGKVEAATDPIDKRDELVRLAEVHENGRQDAGAAFEALSRALEEDASDERLPAELERLAGQLGAYEPLADVLAARASSAFEPDVGRGLFTRLARIAEEQLEDDARAVEAYARAAEQVGDDDQLLGALERLYGKLQSHTELADTLERRVALASDPEHRTELLLRLGELREGPLNDRRAAFQAYQDALEVNPGEERALEALKRLVDDPELAADAVDVLDNAYRQAGGLDKVAELYELRVNLAETSGERVQLLQDAASLWEQDLGDVFKAFDAMRRAFELDPRDEMLVDELERLAGATGSFEGLSGVVERAVDAQPDIDPTVRRDLHLRAARWYENHLAQPDKAEAQLRAALAADPEGTEAHERLTALLRGTERYGELVQALRIWASRELDELSKKERLREAARIAEESSSDLVTAAECYEAILDTDPSDPDALDELIRLRSAEERHREVAELLERRIDASTDPSERLSLRHRLAGLYADALEEPERAVDAYQAALDDDPTDLSTMEALERLYEGAERWDDLRDLIERRLDVATTDDERIAARVRLARLSEQAFGQRQDAIDQLREILELQPSNSEARDELERLLEADERWDELVERLEARAQEAADRGDSGQELSVLGRMANVHAAQGDVDRAIDAHERILDRDPSQTASLRSLRELHEGRQDYGRAADALERLMHSASADEARDAALALASMASEQLDDPARAEEALRRALELDPTASETRDRLKAHYEAHERWAELASMVAEEAEQLEDTEQKVERLKQVADLYQNKLDDPASAATYLERASQLVPTDRAVLLPLCDLYIAAGRQADAVPVLEKIVESFGNRRNKELAQYHHRLGQALEGMGETDRALEHYDAAFKIDLTNVRILRDLGRLCHSRGDYERAQKTFRALLLQKLNSDAGITKADVYYYLGDISAKQGDRAKAVSMLERAVAEQKDHPSATSLLAELKG